MDWYKIDNQNKQKCRHGQRSLEEKMTDKTEIKRNLERHKNIMKNRKKNTDNNYVFYLP